MELPSIVTNINGCNEIIIEGQNGTIIPVKDSVYLAMNKVVEVVEFRQTQQNSLNDSFRYEQQLVWDAILEEYKDWKNV
jgi:glycosyltransferase involved in cell wall biosynthesis